MSGPSLEFLLGSEPPANESDLDRQLRQSMVANAEPDVGAFLRPVNVNFLANVFGMHRNTVIKRLARCPVAEYATRGQSRQPLYDFKTACDFLANPRIDVAQWIKSQRVQDLPQHISDQFWKAMRSKQAWERDAENLWHTQDVLDVFGRVFMLIKETTQTWVEKLPGKATMTNEQYNAFRQMVLDLLNEVHAELALLPSQSETRSSLHSLDQEIASQDEKALSGVTE